MKCIEAEYRSAVAKRTRLGTDRLLVAKLYGESGLSDRKKMRRIPDVELVMDEVEVVGESEREKAPIKRKRRCTAGKRVSGVQVCEKSDVDIPDFVLVDSPVSVGGGGDDQEDSGCWYVGEEDEEVSEVKKGSDQVYVGKGKEKMAVDDELDKAGVALVAESESVWDNGEYAGRGKNRCEDGENVGDSAGSRTGFRSPTKANLDSAETKSGSSSVDRINEMCADIISSGDESDIGESSTDSEDDESDEDFNEQIADVSSSSEYVSDSDVETEEEEICLSAPAPYKVEIQGKKVTCKGKLCSPLGMQEMERVISKEDKLDEKGSSIEKSSCAKSAPMFEGFKLNKTKLNDSVLIVSADLSNEKGSFNEKSSYAKSAAMIEDFKVNMAKLDDLVQTVREETSNHSQDEYVKSCPQTAEPVKFKPQLEATFDWDEGTVCKKPSQKNKSFVESAAPSAVRSVAYITSTDWDEGTVRKIPSQKNKSFVESAVPSAMKSVPHITTANRRKENLDNIYTGEVVYVTDEGRDKLQNTVTEEAADKVKQQEERLVLQEGKFIKPSKKRDRTLHKIDAFDVLFNSLADKRDMVHEDMDNSSDVIQEEKEAEPAAPKSSLPLYFTFGVKVPVKVEKSDFEKELDNLWDEFQFGLKTSQIGCLAQETVKTNNHAASKMDKVYPTLCKLGEHKFALDEEIGVRCLICSFVQWEIKDMTPDFARIFPRRFDRRASSDDEDPEMFDRMKFHNSNGGVSSSCSDGTVWDLIPGVKDKLFHHQRDGFEFIWMNLMGTINLDELQSSENNGMGGCIISHAPGTGKTRLTIEFLLSYLELFPMSCPLIIAPAGMLLTWEAEFKKWGVGIPFHNLNSTVLSGKENSAALNIFNSSKQSSNTNLLRLVKLLSWKKQKSILGLSYSLFEKLAGQRFAEGKESGSSKKKKIDEQAKEFGKTILEHAGLLVLDEGHTPRNPRSRIYKALTNIETKKRIILSGTPFQNNLAELYTILSFVRPDFAQTISPDLKKFCQRKVRMVNVSSGRNGSEADVVSDDREAILELRKKIDPFVHVHKGSVLQKSLPGLKDCVIVLNPPENQKKIVEMIESNSYTNFEFEHKLSLATIHPSLLLLTEKDEPFLDRAMLEACRLDPNEGVKTRFLFEMIRLSEANNEKVLVFSQYLDPLYLIKDQICSLLHWNEGIDVLQLVGSIEQEQRQKIINEFNNPRGSAKVLLASTKACSEGINLVGASRVVLLDVVWNPSVERQAISRAFRLGQKKVVYSYNLIVGRMEWGKYVAQSSKEHVSNLVFCSNDEEERRQVLYEDKILAELDDHSSTKDMFEKIVPYPKDSMFG